MIEYSTNNVKIRKRCCVCGKEVESVELEWMVNLYEEEGKPFPYCCPPCDKAIEERQIAEENERYEREQARIISENLAASGIPDEYRVLLPPVPAVARWIEEHANRNILLHGYTGAGKSTSAGYMGRILISAGKRVKWYALAALLDEWREARKADDADAVDKMFRRLESYDVLILDECDKPISTESTNECMFRLIEESSNGTSHAKIWMFGNFYKGSIESIFGNGEAARRRFNKYFECAMVMQDGTIKKIKL